MPLFLEARKACNKYSSFDQGLTWTQHRQHLEQILGMDTKELMKLDQYSNALCAQTAFVYLSSIDREYSSVLRLGGGFAGGGGRRSAQFIVLCLGSLGVRTPFL